VGARSEFKIRNLKFQTDGDGKGEKKTKARGKFAASGGRYASSGDPVLSHWANLCRAYGAEFIVAFPIRCVSIWQEIYRDCVAFEAKRTRL
jgi:hypothetical protein